jgi:hypothetical protein
MLPNWEESPGAKVEHEVAKYHNIPICNDLTELDELSKTILSEMNYD